MSQLKGWRNNPRLISDEQYYALTQSVRRYGVVDPLIVDQKYRIVGGHQRLEVLKQLRIEKAPVVKLHLTHMELYQDTSITLPRAEPETNSNFIRA